MVFVTVAVKIDVSVSIGNGIEFGVASIPTPSLVTLLRSGFQKSRLIWQVLRWFLSRYKLVHSHPLFPLMLGDW